MTRISSAAFALSAVATAFLSSTALAEGWIINKVSGKASMGSVGSAMQPLTAGMSVPQGSTIVTGANARAMLVRGSETLVVGPNSAIAIQPGQGGLTTTVLQKSGQLTVDVETKQAPHFSVETPFMAAVVKGTMFDVRVSARDASVSVQRGRVQVADFATGQTADITPGLRASVRPGGRPGLNLSGRGPMPAIQSGTPRPALVTPSGGQTAAGAAAPAAPVAAAAPAAATSFDSSSAGFGPGRSWSGSGSNKPRGDTGKAQGGSAAVTSNSGSAGGPPSSMSVNQSESSSNSSKKSGSSSSSPAKFDSLSTPGTSSANNPNSGSSKNSNSGGSNNSNSGSSSSSNSGSNDSNSGSSKSSSSDGSNNSGSGGNKHKSDSGLLTTVGNAVSGTLSNAGLSGSNGNSGSSGSNGLGGGKGLLGRR